MFLVVVCISFFFFKWKWKGFELDRVFFFLVLFGSFEYSIGLHEKNECFSYFSFCNSFRETSLRYAYSLEGRKWERSVPD